MQNKIIFDLNWFKNDYEKKTIFKARPSVFLIERDSDLNKQNIPVVKTIWQTVIS